MESLEYRLAGPQDRGALEELWETETQWGKLTPALWKRWYDDSPDGQSLVVVAVDRNTDGIVGQFTFSAARVAIAGRVVPAYRGYAPIVAKGLRTSAPWAHGGHPLSQMYGYAARTMVDRGAGLIYMLPDRKWMRYLRSIPGVFVATFELWTMPLPMTAPFPPSPGCTTAPLELPEEDVDALWSAASQWRRTLVVRDGAALSRRFGDDAALVVRRGEEVLGIVSYRLQGRKKIQWLVSDLMTPDNHESLHATLEQVCNLAHARALESSPESAIVKISILVTPAIEPVVRLLGFQPTGYFYSLFVHVLDPSIVPEDVDAAHWYITAND